MPFCSTISSGDFPHVARETEKDAGQAVPVWTLAMGTDLNVSCLQRAEYSCGESLSTSSGIDCCS